MKKITAAFIITAALTSGAFSVGSFMGQTVLGARNCNTEETQCTGGFGAHLGGFGGTYEVTGSTFTASGGGGGNNDVRVGGVGGHSTYDFETGLSVSQGGNGDGAGRVVCDLVSCEYSGNIGK